MTPRHDTTHIVHHRYYTIRYILNNTIICIITYMYIYTHMRTYVCIYIYIHTYIHANIYIYIYTYIHTCIYMSSRHKGYNLGPSCLGPKLDPL